MLNHFSAIIVLFAYRLTQNWQFYKWRFWAPVIDPAWMWQFLNTGWYFLISMFVAVTFLPRSSSARLIPSTLAGPTQYRGHTLTQSVSQIRAAYFEVRISSVNIFELTESYFKISFKCGQELCPLDTTTPCHPRYPTIHTNKGWEYGTKSCLPVVFSFGGHWSTCILNR